MRKTANKFTQLFILVSTVSLVGCGGGAETKTDTNKVDPLQPVSDWSMVWNDEFDGDAINSKNWTHELDCNGGGNQEKQCYTDNAENSYVADGKLNIVALPAEEGAALPFTSARMTTRYKADFKYGRIEMRAKAPTGQGSWPAFWMMPTDEEYGIWPRSGEIDIFESVNLGAARNDGTAENHVYGTLHYGKSWPDNSQSGQAYSLDGGVSPADDFHTYAIEWQEGEIRWYMDDYLYATQRNSTIRYNSKDQAVGLSHRGWFTEYFDQLDGELDTYWSTAPFDKDFYIILNFAVGGTWPEAVNELGVDATAFDADNKFEVDYVRVYQCMSDPLTGRGCETIRAGYDNAEDGLVEGKAPIPVPPSDGIAKNLTIFDGTLNANWAAWDCCGGTNPGDTETSPLVADAEKGDAFQFNVNGTPTVLGFTTRGELLPEDFAGVSAPFDAAPLVDLNGTFSFDMKVVKDSAASTWILKIESYFGGPNTGDLNLTTSLEGLNPVEGQWQTYTFTLSALQDAGLDLSTIDTFMIFPAWGTGEGAEYLITNVAVKGDVGGAPQLVVFTDNENPSWPLWDCCGGSTPTVVDDSASLGGDDNAHGNVAEFVVGAQPTVNGFISRAENTETPAPFDASAILANGVLQFDMKVVTAPNDSAAPWILKVEADGAASNTGDYAMTSSNEGQAPVTGEWQTYTFNLADLEAAGLDVSAIDVIMVFPAWGAGEGAVYRIDNLKIHDPTAVAGTPGSNTLFKDSTAPGWVVWDCCGGTTPTLEDDDAAHGMTAEFVIGAQPTVMGLNARVEFVEDPAPIDATSIVANGVLQFDMKVLTAPNNTDSTWILKVESDGAATNTGDYAMTSSNEGQAPVTGEWQTYTFNLSDLEAAGLDVSAIDVIMVFPAWGTGEGAVYRLDNIMIFEP
jgi:beta-glucanase (GH16 family)|tara:strand:+ start:2343 stop:5063 length:2721 start_codon:yes stop_codon:yes gene_type:complete